MTKGNTEAPTVVDHADHQVITPLNKLRNAVMPATADEHDPVARAEQALAEISTEFSGWMDDECERLDAARNEVHRAGLGAANRDALFNAAHDIKGEAATFGFPWAAVAAESLCRLIEQTPDPYSIPPALLDQHVDAIRAIVREHHLPGFPAKATELTTRLRELADDFLADENPVDLGEVDGGISTPNAPGE